MEGILAVLAVSGLEGMLIGLVIIGIIIFSLTIFVIYFIFKSLEFVVLATNLYKKMVNRQDAMLKLLLDVRDNTKKYEEISSYDINSLSSIDVADSFICEDCRKEVPTSAKVCPHCGAEFE